MLDNTKFDRDGFIYDPIEWTKKLAQEIAEKEGISSLEDVHFRVIESLRSHYLSKMQIPVMRLICEEVGFENQDCIRQLFNRPDIAWKIVGLPNPGEEGKVYLQTAEKPK